MTTFICKHCDSQRKNNNSLINHERLCKENPDRQYTKFADTEWQQTFAKGNQYTKAKKLGLPKPEVSNHTRELISKSKQGTSIPKDVRDKISIGMKKAHKENRAWNIGKSRWNNKPSYPEKFFAEVINNEFENKNYTPEFAIGIYSADFCWQDEMKVIEIDGEQHQRFDEYKQRDIRKDEYLTLQGYKILRISWKDMFANPKGKIKEAYQFIHEG